MQRRCYTGARMRPQFFLWASAFVVCHSTKFRRDVRTVSRCNNVQPHDRLYLTLCVRLLLRFDSQKTTGVRRKKRQPCDVR